MVPHLHGKYTGEEDGFGVGIFGIKNSTQSGNQACILEPFEDVGVRLKGMWGNIALLFFSYFADYVDNIFHII